jgi:uncharacterized protein
MLPVLISSPLQVRLPESSPVAAPLGDPIAQMNWLVAKSIPEHEIEAGVWECSPGVWKRAVMSAELCHFIAGHCTFTPDGAEPIEIKPGDAVFFPSHSHGIWDVKETIRKRYVTFTY